MNMLMRFVILVSLMAPLLATEVAFTSTAVTGSEASAGTPIVLTVTRFPTSGSLTVNFSIEDNDTAPELRATVVDDFTINPVVTTTGTLDFADQEASKTITITVVDDGDQEGREYARVRLTSGVGYSVNGSASTALVTIADDDLTVTVENLFPIATEDPTLIGPAYDPGAARRGVMQVLFDGTSTFDKNISATFAGTAIGSDYQLTYRIGGGGLGSALGWTIAAYPAGSTSITISGDTEALPDGTEVVINGDSYFVDGNYPGGAGTLVLDAPLTTAVTPGTTLTITSIATATGYVVTIPVGATSLTLGTGFGDPLQTGDVFYFTTSTARYVALTDPDVNGTFTFRRYTGGNTVNTGLDVAITTTGPSATMQTVFSATAPGTQVILVPAESTQIQFAVTPGNLLTANDGLAEGREVVTLGLALSNDYLVSSPSNGAVTIADIDSKASIALTSNAVHPETAGVITVTLTPPLPQAVTIPYTIQPSSTASSTDYTLSGTPSGTLVIPANTATGQIIVTPTANATIPVGGQTVVFALDSSIDYQRTTGPITSATATLTILPTTGTVDVGTVTNGTEGGSNGAFSVTIVRFPGHDEAVTVNYTIGGTATATADYTPVLSGSVVIPADEDSVSIPITVVNDMLVEGDENITLTITAGSGYVLGDDLIATLTISDNEPVVTVTASDNSATEGGDTATFTISVTPAPSGPITVPFTYSGTGVGAFTASPAALSVAFSNTDAAPKVVTITATDNATVDGNRTLTLTLSAPSAPASYSLGATTTANVTLVDNEPVVTVAASDDSATEGGDTATFTISVTPTPSGPITVPFTYSGTGVGAFTASPAALSVAFSDTDATPKVVTITANDNAVIEGTRTLTLTLSTPVVPATYSLGATITEDVALLDNDIGVIAVDAISPDGSYGRDDELFITVEFASTVTVTGTPVLTLETGATNRQAVYQSGSGSDTLMFRYVVQTDDVSTDLDYVANNSLTLAGGTITHSMGVDAVLTLPVPGAAGSLGANAALVVNGSLGDGKPVPGDVNNGTGGGCGLGSGIATLCLLCMLAGFALTIRRNRP